MLTLSRIWNLCAVGLIFFIQSSSAQYTSNMYGSLTTGSIPYASLYPWTQPVFTSNAINYGYTPAQRVESIYSQLYHPEASYQTNIAAQIRYNNRNNNLAPVRTTKTRRAGKKKITKKTKKKQTEVKRPPKKSKFFLNIRICVKVFYHVF